jgi:hypothetical protein
MGERAADDLLRLAESAAAEGVPNLAEPRGGRGGPLPWLLAETDGILDLAELRGRQDARLLEEVVWRQSGQPRARRVAGTRERESHHAFERQPFPGAQRDLDAPVADADVRRSHDLYHLEPGRLVTRQQHNRPPLVELDPPDLTRLHMPS